jgi:hypothetical protein
VGSAFAENEPRKGAKDSFARFAGFVFFPRPIPALARWAIQLSPATRASGIRLFCFAIRQINRFISWSWRQKMTANSDTLG